MADSKPELQQGEVFEQTPDAAFLRNPEAPTIYAPLIDVRTSPYGLHLLTFVPPAASPADVVLRDGKPVVEIHASSEMIVPLESVERFIRDLCAQFKQTLDKRLRADAQEAGVEVDEDGIEWKGLEDIFAVAATREP